MDDGVAWVGMRVGYNAKARRVPGIGVGLRGDSRLHMKGVVTETHRKNDLGSQLLTVRWDDGETCWLSPDWLRRIEWARGGYTHGKRRDLQKSTEST